LALNPLFPASIYLNPTSSRRALFFLLFFCSKNRPGVTGLVPPGHTSGLLHCHVFETSLGFPCGYDLFVPLLSIYHTTKFVFRKRAFFPPFPHHPLWSLHQFPSHHSEAMPFFFHARLNNVDCGEPPQDPAFPGRFVAWVKFFRFLPFPCFCFQAIVPMGTPPPWTL